MVWRNCGKGLIKMVPLLEKKVLDSLNPYGEKKILN